MLVDINRRAKAFRQHVQSAIAARVKGAQSSQYDKYGMLVVLDSCLAVSCVTQFPK